MANCSWLLLHPITRGGSSQADWHGTGGKVLFYFLLVLNWAINFHELSSFHLIAPGDEESSLAKPESPLPGLGDHSQGTWRPIWGSCHGQAHCHGCRKHFSSSMEGWWFCFLRRHWQPNTWGLWLQKSHWDSFSLMLRNPPECPSV